MCQGKHPLYKKGEDSYLDYLGRLRSIIKVDKLELNPYLNQWIFPENFSL